jgi:hypothetical protein
VKSKTTNIITISVDARTSTKPAQIILFSSELLVLE